MKYKYTIINKAKLNKTKTIYKLSYMVIKYFNYYQFFLVIYFIVNVLKEIILY